MKQTRSRTLVFLFLCVLSLMPLLNLLSPGLPITHDGQDHVARIANFYADLSDGAIIPRWGANLNWGYGHPVLMFLYPLSSYMASAFHAFGANFIDSTKLVFASSYVLSAITMFLWASYVWGTGAGLVAAVLYIFAPYRFVDLYVRGAIGEHVAFIFPPLLFYGLALMAEQSKKAFVRGFIMLSVSTAFLIVAHNALSLLFLPIAALYALYLYATQARAHPSYLFWSVLAVIFGFLFSTWYWVPAFFEGKYTLRDIVTAGDYSTRFVPWIRFLFSPWSYGGSDQLSKWLGAGQLLTVVFAWWNLEKSGKYQKLIIGLFLICLFSLFLMTAGSLPIWNSISLLQKFQFPWRLLAVPVLLFSVLGAVVVAAHTDGKRRLVAALIMIVSVASTIGMWRAREYKTYNESFFTGIYNSTTDTGESSPIWSVRFMEKQPETPAYLWPPNGSIKSVTHSTSLRSYTVVVAEPSRFVENTLYFPGWQVFVDGALLPVDRLQFQDPTYRGLITFELAPGTYRIDIRFANTKMRTVAEYISVGSLFVYVLIIGTMSYIWAKNT